MVSGTTTMFMFYNDKILLGKRDINADAFAGFWSVPGGFVDAQVMEDGVIVKKGECVEDTAVREIMEETNIVVNKDQLTLFGVSSNPNTDSRAHIINNLFLVELSNKQISTMKAGDDLMEIKFVTMRDIDDMDLAFNHKELICKAIAFRNSLSYKISKLTNNYNIFVNKVFKFTNG